MIRSRVYSYIFNLKSTHGQTVFQSSCSPQQGMEVPVILHPHLHVGLYVLVSSPLVGVWWHFIVVLLCSSLTPNAVEHLFMCSFAILRCCWVKALFKSTEVT